MIIYLVDEAPGEIKKGRRIDCGGKQEALRKFRDEGRHLYQIHSWYEYPEDELLVNQAIRGDLAAIKEWGYSDEMKQHLSKLRFCMTPTVDYKYQRDGLAFDGHNLLDVAFYNGRGQLADYLMEECGMNPHDTSYGNPVWVSLFPAQGNETKNQQLEQDRFDMFRRLVEAGKIEDNQVRNFRSTQAHNTVFHLAGDIANAEVRTQALCFLAEKFPDIAAVKNGRGSDGRTAATKFFSRRVIKALKGEEHYSHDSVFDHVGFKQDLEILCGCGGFQDFQASQEYDNMVKMYDQRMIEDHLSKQRFLDDIAHCVSQSGDRPSSSPSMVEIKNSSEEKASGQTI